MSLFDYFKKKQEAKLQAARKPAFSALHTEKGEYMAFQDKLIIIIVIHEKRGVFGRGIPPKDRNRAGQCL